MCNEKIVFYHTMEQLVCAGVPLLRIFNGAMPPSLRQPCRRIAQRLDNGDSLTDAFKQEPVFNDTETALIYAGEATGTLDQSAKALAAMFEQKKAFKAQVTSALAQPALTYIVAGPLLKIADLGMDAAGKGGPDFGSWAGPLVIRCLLWWGMPLALLLLLKLAKPVSQSTAVGGFINMLPFFGKLQHRVNSASFWRTFGTCISAGIPCYAAIRISANACSNGFYRHHFRNMETTMTRSSLTLSDAFANIALHQDFTAQYTDIMSTGDMSGHLDDAAAHIASMASQDASNSLKRLATVLPLALYLALAGFIAFKIIGFYADYIGKLTSM